MGREQCGGRHGGTGKEAHLSWEGAAPPPHRAGTESRHLGSQPPNRQEE